MLGVSMWKVWVITCAGLATSQQITKDFPAGNTLCDRTVCMQNETCRLVQACAGSVCPPKITCLDCVPKGADDVCDKNGFSASVLIGSATQPSTLIGRGCDPNQPDGEPNCPTDSRCVPDDSSSRGTCCYGKQDPAQQVGITTSNNTNFCTSECGECRPEYVCRKILIVCKKLPCLPRFSCVQKEKKGTCPRYTTLGSSWCSRNKRVRCNNDFECFGRQKCCSDTCGGLRCKRPRN
ncbi:unnamed protein product [Candidula unifasciata]|uniref:WAP domain-containing protein n=1 Tax=Candidula unifasciata TaxID=100452 RepID=A0A8S3ZXX3_9EUPU|nr:unnamed protein product [Candidula unifasciata]